MLEAKFLAVQEFTTKTVVTLFLALMSVTFPVGMKAQRVSVSDSSSKMMYFSFVNGGGVEIASNVGLVYSGALNRRVENYADPLFMTMNDTVMIDGVPESMQQMNEKGILYQHELNPEVSEGKINLRNQSSLSVRIGGTLAIYQDMMAQSQNVISPSSSGQSLSVFPSFFPSVFSSNAGL